MIFSVESQKGINAVLLKTRRALWLYKVYGFSSLLVLYGTSQNGINALFTYMPHILVADSVKRIVLSNLATFCSVAISFSQILTGREKERKGM